MTVKRRKSQITGKWVWNVVSAEGITISPHFHTKAEAQYWLDTYMRTTARRKR